MTGVCQVYNTVVSHKICTTLQICRLGEDVWGPENVSVIHYLYKCIRENIWNSTHEDGLKQNISDANNS